MLEDSLEERLEKTGGSVPDSEKFDGDPKEGEVEENKVLNFYQFISHLIIFINISHLIISSFLSGVNFFWWTSFHIYFCRKSDILPHLLFLFCPFFRRSQLKVVNMVHLLKN